jgi:hypothetical protein
MLFCFFQNRELSGGDGDAFQGLRWGNALAMPKLARGLGVLVIGHLRIFVSTLGEHSAPL